MVRAHAALPDVDSHLDHVRHQRRRVAVRMVNDDLEAVVVVAAVQPLVGLQEELGKHVGREERRLGGAPVVVVPDDVRVQPCRHQLHIPAFPVGDVLDELVHALGLGQKRLHGRDHAHEGVDVLEQAREHNGPDKDLVPVVLAVVLLRLLPDLLREVERGRMNLLLPAGDVLNHEMLAVLPGERAGDALRPHPGDAPQVLGLRHLRRPGLGIGRAVWVGEGIHHEVELVDEAVGMAAVDGFQKVLSRCQHRLSPPS